MKSRIESFFENVRLEMEQAGRKPDDLTVIGVSKFFPVEYARIAVRLGLTDLGENRVSELLDKRAVLETEGLFPRWHLIGTLQTNKVKRIIGKAALIHSVDSLHLAEEISKQSCACEIVTPILLQINVSGEESKHGFTKGEAKVAIQKAGDLPGIDLCGLMTMAPIMPCAYTPYMVFQELNELFHSVRPLVRNPEKWMTLSMGMSQDYSDAIRCGATHIRIGTSIFGPRTE